MPSCIAGGRVEVTRPATNHAGAPGAGVTPPQPAPAHLRKQCLPSKVGQQFQQIPQHLDAAGHHRRLGGRHAVAGAPPAVVTTACRHLCPLPAVLFPRQLAAPRCRVLLPDVSIQLRQLAVQLLLHVVQGGLHAPAQHRLDCRDSDFGEGRGGQALVMPGDACLGGQACMQGGVRCCARCSGSIKSGPPLAPLPWSPPLQPGIVANSLQVSPQMPALCTPCGPLLATGSRPCPPQGPALTLALLRLQLPLFQLTRLLISCLQPGQPVQGVRGDAPAPKSAPGGGAGGNSTYGLARAARQMMSRPCRAGEQDKMRGRQPIPAEQAKLRGSDRRPAPSRILSPCSLLEVQAEGAPRLLRHLLHLLQALLRRGELHLGLGPQVAHLLLQPGRGMEHVYYAWPSRSQPFPRSPCPRGNGQLCKAVCKSPSIPIQF